MLSNTCKYAVRAVIYLASGYEGNMKYGIKKISDDLGIPAPFLGKILQKLVKAEILKSNKGPNGGFCLASSPDEISLYDVVQVIDGGEFFDKCLICDHVNCSAEIENQKDHCALHVRFKNIRLKISELFKMEKISDLLAESREIDGDLRF